MNNRKDALLCAAKVIQAINRVVTTVHGRHVGTVGQIKVIPGAPNVIPGQVIMSLELRDLDMAKIELLYTKISADALKIAREEEVAVKFVETYKSQAALTDEELRESISDAATSLGLTTLRMPSGAGHDAQSIAQIAPVGMVFIPSVDGISHSPSPPHRCQFLADGESHLARCATQGTPRCPRISVSRCPTWQDCLLRRSQRHTSASVAEPSYPLSHCRRRGHRVDTLILEGGGRPA